MNHKHTRALTVLLFSLVIALLVGCSGAVADPEPGADGGVVPATVDMEDVVEETRGGEMPEEMPAPGIPDPEAFMRDQVTIALAEHLGVDLEDISVADISPMEWPDASLGCPAPDQMYAQVITPGFRIELEVDGESYTYHTDAGGSLILCDSEGRPVTEDS